MICIGKLNFTPVVPYSAIVDVGIFSMPINNFAYFNFTVMIFIIMIINRARKPSLLAV